VLQGQSQSDTDHSDIPDRWWFLDSGTQETNREDVLHNQNGNSNGEFALHRRRLAPFFQGRYGSAGRACDGPAWLGHMKQNHGYAE